MGIFSEDSLLGSVLLKIWDLVLTNLLFIVCSIPIITIGPALTAMYHCTLRIVKGTHTGTLKTFFRAFKNNFKQSIVVWLVTLLFAGITYADVTFLNAQNTSMTRILMYMIIIIAVFVVIINLFIYPVIAAFEGTLKMQLRNAFIFAGKHLFTAFLMFNIWFIPMLLTYFDTQMQPLYVFCWAFFLFSTLAYINSFMLYKMFKPYLGKDETERINNFHDEDGQAYLP